MPKLCRPSPIRQWHIRLNRAVVRVRIQARNIRAQNIQALLRRLMLVPLLLLRRLMLVRLRHQNVVLRPRIPPRLNAQLRHRNVQALLITRLFPQPIRRRQNIRLRHQFRIQWLLLRRTILLPRHRRSLSIKLP